MKKLFIIRKYVWANSAKHAIKLDKKQPVEDVWVDDEWKKAQPSPGEIGFYNRK